MLALGGNMTNKGAKTAWGPMFQVALEQLAPEAQRVVQDALVFQLMPVSFTRFIKLCQLNFLRMALFFVMEHLVPGIRGGILCRKRYVEEKLKNALDAGFQVVVILGAGFDTLAYRLSGLASQQVFEVDLPEVIQSKKVELTRVFGEVPSHVKLVAIDFDHQDLESVMLKEGCLSEKPIFFVWEGVTQYISETAVHAVFKYFKQALPGSQLVFTYIRKDFIDGKQKYGLPVLYRQTRTESNFWQFGLEPDAIGDLLSQYSWIELEQVGSAEYQERFLTPLNRMLPVMEVERAVHAEKAAY
jgi:methyltransferase (TIGR00027 family)